MYYGDLPRLYDPHHTKRGWHRKFLCHPRFVIFIFRMCSVTFQSCSQSVKALNLSFWARMHPGRIAEE